VWEQPDQDSGILAMQASIAIRDTQPDRFLDAHHALFEHRHAAAGELKSRDVLTDVLAASRVDTDAAWALVDAGGPLATIEKEHTAFVESHKMWGVPTFIIGDRSVFVRLVDGAQGDGDLARRTIERVLDLIEWPILNEFKHTSIPR
jgi:protein-disulfide isomerase-like protein with CxxC motif